jgi:hypothetical protein
LGIDFPCVLLIYIMKEVLVAQVGSAAFGFLTRPYAANAHKDAASVSVAGWWFRVRACVARCQ